MVSIEPIKSDLRSYGAKGVAMLVGLTLVAAGLLAVSVAGVVTGPPELMLGWAALALVIAFTSARHPIRFPGTNTSVSVSEALVFLGVIVLGPYHGALLAVFEMLVAVRRLKIKPSLQLLTSKRNHLDVCSRQTYYALADFLASHHLAEGLGQAVLAFAMPLIALSFAHYVLHIAVLAGMFAARGNRTGQVVRDTLPGSR